ncbi:DUF3604 domain-containing protein [Myxococcota bacterium]|nr:DUF3604 domain-containing protein [Myxococcota bacterium]
MKSDAIRGPGRASKEIRIDSKRRDLESARRPTRCRASLFGGLLTALLAGSLACDRSNETDASTAAGQPTPGATEAASASPDAGHERASAPARDPLKQAYYGDLHVHTSWSLDAFAFGVRVGPEDAYRFARGGEIDHISGVRTKLAGPPLDFIALTEHANYLGVASQAMKPESEARAIPLLRDFLSDDAKTSGAAMASIFGHLSADRLMPELNRSDWAQSTWQEMIRLADRQNLPGEFTALVGYEYTPMPEGQNLHRNVIFRGSDVPVRPFSDLDSKNPEDLWAWMEKARATGSDVLAIPHNANGSNGLMYERVDRAGKPIDARYAEIRLRNEPISEVYQIKGQSEAHPALSPTDEWAGFEMLEGILGRPAVKSRPQGSYVRRALMDGLELEAAGLPNPYRMGMIGSSDSHNATSPTEEDNFTGKLGTLDGTPEARLQLGDGNVSGLSVGSAKTGSPFGSGGLAGVWAHSNTREDLFDAMRAREVFATSGPRIAVRLFGGFELEPADLERGIAAAGYERGVPMGGVLEAKAGDERPAIFLVEALQDPHEAPLERIQIVKAWVGPDGKARERIYDVACARGAVPDPTTRRCPIESRPPDLSTCRVAPDHGQSQLSAAFSAPDYQPGERSFYYARVLQVPTCRWSSWDALRLKRPPLPGAVAFLQERAVTSPIWIEPPGQAAEWASSEDGEGDQPAVDATQILPEERAFEH